MRDNIARFLMGEFLGVTWERAYDATDRILALTPWEPLDEETASALRSWQEDHEATRDYYASMKLQEQKDAIAALRRLVGSPDVDCAENRALAVIEESLWGPRQ